MTDAEVMDEVDRRLAYYINMIGSVEAFEAQYGKTVTQWKDDFGKPIKDQLLAQKMQQEVNTGNLQQMQHFFGKIGLDAVENELSIRA